MRKFAEYAKLMRLPGLGGLAIPPVFGAISVGVYSIEKLAILFVIGSLATIFGFVLNDYADVELDKLVPELRNKPLVKGVISRKDAVAICMISTILSFFLIFYLWRGEELNELKFAAATVITIAGVLGTVYNIYGKKLVGSDFFVALSMSFLFLFGALSFSKPTMLTWIIFMLTFNQTLHMNAVEGGIKDADHDFIMGVKNIALLSGVKVENGEIFIPWHFRIFGMLIRLLSVFLVFLPFIYGMKYEIWQIALLALLMASVLWLEIRLLTIKKFERSEIRRIISAAAFMRYSAVPVMLISSVGIIALLLAVFPIAWYIIFSPLAGVKLFHPEM
ncbi:MAG: UbiA prenyltransferase family protein [Thermoplasmata archaeon]|nr:UbiA prenyltransferase family protein [Thermoplasmata archaeon]